MKRSKYRNQDCRCSPDGSAEGWHAADVLGHGDGLALEQLLHQVVGEHEVDQRVGVRVRTEVFVVTSGETLE